MTQAQIKDAQDRFEGWRRWRRLRADGKYQTIRQKRPAMPALYVVPKEPTVDLTPPPMDAAEVKESPIWLVLCGLVMVALVIMMVFLR